MTKTLQNALHTMKREKMMTLSNISIMTITFVLLGLFVFLVAGTQTALRYLEQQAQVTVFFKDDFPEENIMALKAQYEGDPRIAEVKYVSKEDAFKIFTEINKDEPVLLESISASILPASLELKAHNIGNLSPLSQEFTALDGVEEVRFFEDVIARFKLWSTVAYIVGFALVAVFILVSYSIIIGSLRTTINSKGEELEIMKVVGASNSYVKNPLLLQGVIFGLSSALMASILMILLGFAALNSGWFASGVALGFLTTFYIPVWAFTLFLVAVLVFSGALLGYVGSYSAVKRYLKY